MGWLENYREASFRNVKFFVQNHELSGGARGTVHEFPGHNVPLVEDMGRRARRFSLEAYVLGDSYFTQRNRLQNALEGRGEGKLVHPYLGTIMVMCLSYTLRETSDELRIARFSLSLVEVGDTAFPALTKDTQGAVDRKKWTTLDAIKAAFDAVYTLANKPYAITQNVLQAIDTGFSLIESGKKTLSAVSDFQRDIQNMRGKVSQLAYDGLELAENVSDILTFGSELTTELVDLAATARAQFDEMLTLDDQFQNSLPLPLNAEDPTSLTATLMQQVAIANAVGFMAVMSYDSVNEARSIQQQVFLRLDSLADATGDDTLYTQLLELRKAAMEDLEARAITLPSLVKYTPIYATNTLALSWALYGEIESEADLIRRNRLVNPALVPGSRELEVLSSAA